MLKVANYPTFVRQAKIQVPSGDGVAEETCMATFKVLDSDAQAAFDLATAEGTIAFLRAAIARLDDLATAEAKPIVYSEEARDQLLKLPYVRIGLAAAYFEGVNGAKRGN